MEIREAESLEDGLGRSKETAFVPGNILELDDELEGVGAT